MWCSGEMKVLPILSKLIKSWESNIRGIFLTIAHMDNYFINYIIACVYTRPSGNFQLLGNICSSLKKKFPVESKRLEICFPFLCPLLGALERMLAFWERVKRRGKVYLFSLIRSHLGSTLL